MFTFVILIFVWIKSGQPNTGGSRQAAGRSTEGEEERERERQRERKREAERERERQRERQRERKVESESWTPSAIRYIHRVHPPPSVLLSSSSPLPLTRARARTLFLGTV